MRLSERVIIGSQVLSITRSEKQVPMALVVFIVLAISPKWAPLLISLVKVLK
jgi:hypothetical protein